MAFSDMQLQRLHTFFPNVVKDNNSPGLVDALFAASRGASLINVEQLQTQNGKMRTLRAHYYGIDCNSVATDCSTTICDTSTAMEPTYKDFTPNKCIKLKNFHVEIDDIKGLDDGSFFIADHLAAQFAAKMPALRKEFSTRLATLMVAAVGENPSGTTSRLISLINANGSMDVRGVDTISKDFTDATLLEPYIVGGGDVFTWARNGGRAAANGGIDLAKLRYDNIWYDNTINAAYPADATHGHIIAFDPRLVKLVTWSENVGKFATDLNGFKGLERMFYENKRGIIHGVVYDPVWKVFFDFNAMPEDCPELYKVEIKLNYDLLTMPALQCVNADMTGIMHYTTCLPAAVVCA